MFFKNTLFYSLLSIDYHKFVKYKFDPFLKPLHIIEAMTNEKRKFSQDELNIIIEKVIMLQEVLNTGVNSLTDEQIAYTLPLAVSIERQLLKDYEGEILQKVNVFERKIEYAKVKHEMVDICRDVYLKAIQSTARQISEGKFEKRSKIKTFFSSIFDNKIIDEIRRKTTKKANFVSSREDILQKLSESSKSILYNTENTAIRQFDNDDIKQSYTRALNQLGERCQIIIKLKLSLLLSHEQIEDILRVFGDTKTYNRMIFKECLNSLRQHLSKLGIDGYFL
jgi:DNA-directed RNA polymerase specialized sigma24 family protein